MLGRPGAGPEAAHGTLTPRSIPIDRYAPGRAARGPGMPDDRDIASRPAFRGVVVDVPMDQVDPADRLAHFLTNTAGSP